MIGLVAGAIAAGIAALPSPSPQRWRGAPEAYGEKIAVATDNADASRVALEVLRRGGDAVDAAAAAAFTLGVVSPTASGIGGGGFAVVWRAKEHRAYLIDFRETAPAELDPRSLDVRPPARRGFAVGVPGEVAGLFALTRKFGKKSWESDVRPAIDLAEGGFTLSPFLHRVPHLIPPSMASMLAVAPALGIPIHAGVAVPEGARGARPQLGATLRAIAERGPTAFYEGPIADAMVAAARAEGSAITADDLASYAPIWREPLRMKFGSREVVTMPPPSAGGVMLLQTLEADQVLRATTGVGLDRDPLGSASYFHRMAELMRGSLDDRARFLGDPSVVKVDTAMLLSRSWIDARLAKISDEATHAPSALRVDEHGTSHLSIVDADGDIVALTTTVNDPFGAGIVAGDTGILLNDELADFSRPSPSDVTPGPNAARPGARPVSSMTPTIVLDGGEPIAVVGGSGGTRIATSVTLVLVSRLVFGASAGEAIGWPRIHPSDADLLVEAELPSSVRDELADRGERVVLPVPSLNAVQMITLERRAGGLLLTAAADPRKNGSALAE